PCGHRQVVSCTPHHQEASGTTPSTTYGSASRCSRPRNTYDHPNRSASVTWPVAATNSPNSALVTVVGEIRNPPTVTVRTGPSPSSGNTSAASLPIRNDPAGITGQSLWSVPPVGTAATGAPAGSGCGTAPPAPVPSRLGPQHWLMTSDAMSGGG